MNRKRLKDFCIHLPRTVGLSRSRVSYSCLRRRLHRLITPQFICIMFMHNIHNNGDNNNNAIVDATPKDEENFLSFPLTRSERKDSLRSPTRIRDKRYSDRMLYVVRQRSLDAYACGRMPRPTQVCTFWTETSLSDCPFFFFPFVAHLVPEQTTQFFSSSDFRS